MNDYARPPDQGEKKGRDAFAEHTREWSSGDEHGWCRAASKAISGAFDMMNAGYADAGSLVADFIEEASRLGRIDLLRQHCKQYGVEL